MPNTQSTERWYSRHAAIVWAITAAFVAVWRYTAPAVFNSACLDRLIELRGEAFCILAIVPYPDMADEHYVLLNTGIATLAIAYIVLFPTVISRAWTRWSSLVFLLTTAGLVVLSFRQVIHSLVFWNALLVASLALATVVGCLSARTCSHKTNDHPVRFRLNAPLHCLSGCLLWLAKPLKLSRSGAIAILGLGLVITTTDLFLLMPRAFGLWSADRYSEFVLTDEVTYLLQMKDHNSNLHAQLVTVYLQTPEYCLVRLCDQIPQAEPASGRPGTQPANENDIHRLYSPILVTRASIESITGLPSPKGVLAAAERGGLPEPQYTVKKTPDGGYEMEMHWTVFPRAGATPESTSQPAQEEKTNGN